jgi:radical SAM superfamily enzyme YgiQ (UPF0313 family)
MSGVGGEQRVLAGGGDFTRVAGLAVRQEGASYVITPPRVFKSGPMSWPKFDRTLLPSSYTRHYWQCFERSKTVYTVTTAGCPHRCKFCALWAVARGTYRRRKPEEIVEDICSQPQPFVHITDDNTFHNADHAMEIFRLLKQRGVRKKILAYARTDTIVNRADVLEKWKEVGLGALVVGMEAASDRHLTSVNKRTSLNVNIEAQRVLDRLGIENWAHFVLLPEFDREDFETLAAFVDRHNICYPIFVPLTPVPGTPMFFEKKGQGDITTLDYRYCTLQYMMLRTTKLTKREWYGRMQNLYFRTCSASTVWRRRKSPQFHWRPMLGRAFIFDRSMRKIDGYYNEQIEHERTTKYDDVEPTLPPSLRRDYRPVNYYNAPTLAAVDAALAVAPVAGGG